MCLSLLLCTVGSFSEHLDQINARIESVDSTDNSSKPSSETASHMARQRLESTEKKKISGKVTKSLSASALSLMIPGGRDESCSMSLFLNTLLLFESLEWTLSQSFLTCKLELLSKLIVGGCSMFWFGLHARSKEKITSMSPIEYLIINLKKKVKSDLKLPLLLEGPESRSILTAISSL